MTFITHARTLTELRDEFLSDIHRRLLSLDTESRYEKRIGRLQAIARAKMELESLLGFWQDIELRGDPRSKLQVASRDEPRNQSSS